MMQSPWCLLTALLLLGGPPSIGTEGPDNRHDTSHAPNAGSLSGAGDACLRYRDSGYDILYTAKTFSRGKVGPEGDITPVEVRALRCMVQESNAVTWLTDLVRAGTIPGQLYALVGLRALDQSEFKRLVRQYTSNRDTVRTHGGDIVMSHPIAVVVTGIESGEYVHDLLPDLRHLVPETGSQVEWVEPEHN